MVQQRYLLKNHVVNPLRYCEHGSSNILFTFILFFFLSREISRFLPLSATNGP